MKKLIVCGCSYSAVSSYKDHKGTSWSELLAKKLGWELQNIARQGCSNGGIRIQIDEVIRQRPDFAIITPTSYDRIEIPNFKKNIKPKINGLNFIPQLMNFILRPTEVDSVDDKKSYHKDAGLDNINYGTNDSRMISETIQSLVEDWIHTYRPDFNVPKEVRDALVMYLNHLYEPKWKKQTDEWIIRDGLVQLKNHNISFLVNPGFSMWASLQEMEESLANVIDEKYRLSDESKNPFHVYLKHPPSGAELESPYGKKDPGYHTSYEGQEIIADHFYEIIKNRWGL